MEIKKIETNYKRKLFFYESKVSSKNIVENMKIK